MLLTQAKFPLKPWEASRGRCAGWGLVCVTGMTTFVSEKERPNLHGKGESVQSVRTAAQHTTFIKSGLKFTVKLLNERAFL